MERSAVDRVQSAYGDKYNPLMMYDCKRDVAEILHEEVRVQSVREFLRKQQKPLLLEQRREKRSEPER